MSQQPVDSLFDDGHVTVTREDVTDQALLPKRFDLLVSEVRQLAEDVRALPRLIGDRVERIFDAFAARLDEHSRRHAVHEERLDRHDAAITETRTRLAKLEAEAASKPTRSRRKKR